MGQDVASQRHHCRKTSPHLKSIRILRLDLPQCLNIPTQPIPRLSKSHLVHQNGPPKRQGREDRHQHEQGDAHARAREQDLHGFATSLRRAEPRTQRRCGNDEDRPDTFLEADYLGGWCFAEEKGDGDFGKAVVNRMRAWSLDGSSRE